jgi:hypothetical protein
MLADPGRYICPVGTQIAGNILRRSVITALSCIHKGCQRTIVCEKRIPVSPYTIIARGVMRALPVPPRAPTDANSNEADCKRRPS